MSGYIAEALRLSGGTQVQVQAQYGDSSSCRWRIQLAGADAETQEQAAGGELETIRWHFEKSASHLKR